MKGEEKERGGSDGIRKRFGNGFLVAYGLDQDNDPLPSNRQHLSYDVCLEVRGEIIRTVLCCTVY